MTKKNKNARILLYFNFILWKIQLFTISLCSYE
nr:MAG TPA: hypothetical protein [Inoviridae sp.]